MSRQIEESLGDLEGGRLEIEHRRGDVRIIKASGNEASLSLHIEAEARDKEELEQFLQVFELSVSGSGKNKRVETKDLIKSWVNSLGRSRVKLKNGDVYNGIKKLKLELIVSVPDLEKLSVSNRYEDVHLPSLTSDVLVDLYSGELHASDITGDVELKIKYGKATLESCGDLRMDLYESEVRTGNAGKTNIESKYSELELGDLSSLELSSYEDELSAGSVREASRIVSKYGEFSFKTLNDLEIDFYESDLETAQVGKVEGDCKYGKLQLGVTKTIDLHSDYEMKVDAETCEDLVLRESKYGEYEIDQIVRKAKIQAYETDVQVEDVADQFESLWIDSKYDQVTMPLPNTLSYSLDAELKYGDLIYNRDQFANHDRQEKSSTIRVLAGSENPQATVFIRSYETDVRLSR